MSFTFKGFGALTTFGGVFFFVITGFLPDEAKLTELGFALFE